MDDTNEPPHEQARSTHAVGRIRQASSENDELEAVEHPEATTVATERSNWSLPAILLGVVAILVMIGVLLMIIWFATLQIPG